MPEHVAALCGKIDTLKIAQALAWESLINDNAAEIIRVLGVDYFDSWMTGEKSNEEVINDYTLAALASAA